MEKKEEVIDKTQIEWILCGSPLDSLVQHFCESKINREWSNGILDMLRLLSKHLSPVLKVKPINRSTWVDEWTINTLIALDQCPLVEPIRLQYMIQFSLIDELKCMPIELFPIVLSYLSETMPFDWNTMENEVKQELKEREASQLLPLHNHPLGRICATIHLLEWRQVDSSGSDWYNRNGFYTMCRILGTHSRLLSASQLAILVKSFVVMIWGRACGKWNDTNPIVLQSLLEYFPNLSSTSDRLNEHCYLNASIRDMQSSTE